MAKTVYGKLCWTVLLVSAGSVFGQTDQGIVLLELKDRSNNGPPDTLPVYVEVATVQPDVEQGIVFTLNIENNSSQTVRIHDPVDRIGLNLFGLTNPKIKSLPDTKPDSSICRIRSYTVKQIKAMLEDKRSKKPFQAFDADEARRDPRIKTVSDIVPWILPQEWPARTPHRTTPLNESDRFDASVGGKLTLEPGQRFQAVLQITKVMADRKTHKKALSQWRLDNIKLRATTNVASPPRPEPDIITMPSGKYSLYVTITLSTDNAGSYTATSYSVLSDGVTIQLGELSSSEKSDTIVP